MIISEGDDGYFVYLRGKKQYVVIEGKGEPTIVFLTGKGRPQTDFRKVYEKLQETNCIFSYDRSGIGQSELIRNDRTIDTMAFELHALLVKERIKPPYILVGHSLGGSIARCFVNMYPDMVSGMVFLDPAHEEEFKNGMAIRNDSDKVVFKEQFEEFLKVKGKTKGQHAESKQCFDFDTLGYSTNQKILKQTIVPANIPITLILSTEADIDNDYIDKEIEYRKLHFNQWKLINPQTKIINAPKTGYFIQMEEPKMVVNEIKEMIEKTKK
ncbi:MAG: alpha/beta hydrolase [Bacteroidetes bacterium]|nr:alpha/beta hydrolase [Bacteroidota bacterium]